MSIEKLGPANQYIENPKFASVLSWTAYEAWATSELIAPDDRRYARRKLMEETGEFLDEPDDAKVADEAGDVIWTIVASRALVYKEANIVVDAPLQEDSFDGIVELWDFSGVNDDELVTWLRDGLWLYQRKIRLALVVGETASVQAKREYIVDVIDHLAPLLVAEIAEVTKRRSGVTIGEILSHNVKKIERRIADHALDKATRS